MKKPLVSIITPCYNGETFVSRFLDSVLAQTYKNIELIIVNDGSTDKTEEIILSYEKSMQDTDISFIYLSQENKGQSAALNKGLKIFKGDYLTWPDSDDILDENYVKIKTNFLENNLDIGMVISKCRMIDEDNFNQIGVLQRTPPKENDNLFHDLIALENVFFTPGGYMVRSEEFLKINPKRDINENRVGQNWQMLLPMAYYSKYAYINEFLYDYLVRVSSHSRQEKSKDKILEKYNNHKLLLINIINDMNIKEKEEYLNIIEDMTLKRRLNLAYQFNDRELFDENYRLLKNNNLLNPRFRLMKLSMDYKLVNILVRLRKQILKLVKGNR